MKKNKKKIMITALAFANLIAFPALAQESFQRFSEGGRTLNIASWNNLIQDYYNQYIRDTGIIPDNVQVNFIITPNMSNSYQNMIDEALVSNRKLSPEERIDLFLVEPDYMNKYIDLNYTLDLRKDLGFTDSDIKNQFRYSVDIGTNVNGELKALADEICPSGFIYRRSIAKAVFGTDDPAKVQKKIKSWKDFEKTSRLVKEKGYYMTGALNETQRPYTSARTTSLVNNFEYKMDKTYRGWTRQAKNFLDKDYTTNTYQWSAAWIDGMKSYGKVFGYFGPQWFIDYVMATMSDMNYYNEFEISQESFGDWAFCKGPAPFNWGGNWFCAAEGTDNAKEVSAFIKALTCNTEIMKKLSADENIFVNNRAVMTERSKSDYGNSFLGGQNYYGTMIQCADAIKYTRLSNFDAIMEEIILNCYQQYFSGYITEQQADENVRKEFNDRFRF